MRIGICGAQSVGKTTLLNALRSESFFENYAICNEVTRRVGKYLPINEAGNDATQIAIVKEHFWNLLMHTHMLTDRTLVDACVYTLYLLDNDQCSFETFVDVEHAMAQNFKLYDVLFFIEPEFAIEDDGVRSVDQKFQQRINEIFIEVFESYDIPFVKLSGSVMNRVQTALNHLGKIKNERN